MVGAGDVGRVHPRVVGRPQQALPEDVEEDECGDESKDKHKNKDDDLGNISG